MAAARVATLPARGPADRDLAVPSAPHVQHVLALLSATLLVLPVLLVPVQLHFFIDMPILNMLMQRLPEAVIIVFLTAYGSDTNHLTIVQPPPPYKTPDVCWRCGRTHDIVPLWECARCGATYCNMCTSGCWCARPEPELMSTTTS